MESKWISVKDRLPEKEVEVLVSCVNPSGSRSMEIASYCNYPEDYEWLSNKEDTHHGGYLWVEGEITHWMYKPEDPKD